MTAKIKYIVACISLLTAFAVGRYTSTPTKQTSDTTINKQVDKDVHTQTQTVTTKEPDGTVKTITTTDTVSSTKSEMSKTVEVSKSNSKLNVSLLAAYDFHQEKVAYGASVTKSLAGPITIGVFGLNNKTAGISLGLDF